jgi:hypothetical protein
VIERRDHKVIRRYLRGRRIQQRHRVDASGNGQHETPSIAQNATNLRSNPLHRI